jgi:uncharacterized UBP type Zn finger protein
VRARAAAGALTKRREVLTALGRKHDQYRDFGQQDAHEFLRQLLDAMRMEELDVRGARQDGHGS